MSTNETPLDSVLDTGAPFEQIVERLRGVVERLEEGELPLEDSLSMFEQGVVLSRLGQKRLDEAERRVELLLADEPEVKTRELDKES